MSERPDWANELISEMAGLRAEIGGVRAEVGELRAEFASFRSWVEVEFATLKAEFAALRIRLERIEGEILPKLRADVMDRIDRLQTRLDQFRDESFVNLTSTERTTERVDSLRREMDALGSQVGGLTRLVHKLGAEIDQLRGH